MNPINIAIHDTRNCNNNVDFNPRFYDLSKKLAFFVRYLNSNYEGLFVNGGVSGMTNFGVGCFFVINGVALQSGQAQNDDIGISAADRGFLLREQFDENEFMHFAATFIGQLEARNIKIKRRA